MKKVNFNNVNSLNNAETFAADLSHLKEKAELKEKLEKLLKKYNYKAAVIEIFYPNENPITGIVLYENEDEIKNPISVKLVLVVKTIEELVQQNGKIIPMKMPTILVSPDLNLEKSIFNANLNSALYKITEDKNLLDSLLEDIANIIAIKKINQGGNK